MSWTPVMVYDNNDKSLEVELEGEHIGTIEHCSAPQAAAKVIEDLLEGLGYFSITWSRKELEEMRDE